jgi:hypothetical protein
MFHLLISCSRIAGKMTQAFYMNCCTFTHVPILQPVISYVSYPATLITTCKILGSHSSNVEDSSSLGYDAVLLDE